METILPLNNPRTEGLREWLRRSGRLLSAPGRFFRFDFPLLDTPSLLAFGVANAWAASALAFFLQTMNSLLLSRLLDRWMQRLLSSEDGFSVWALSSTSFLYTSGLLLLGPFLFLLQSVFFAGWLYTFARLLIEDRSAVPGGTPEPVTYGACLRIQACALGAHWYSLVPVFGGILALLASLMIGITGVRERFGVSTRRAAAVVLAPYLLLFFGLCLLGALALVAVSQIPLQELLEGVDMKGLNF